MSLLFEFNWHEQQEHKRRSLSHVLLNSRKTKEKLLKEKMEKTDTQFSFVNGCCMLRLTSNNNEKKRK